MFPLLVLLLLLQATTSTAKNLPRVTLPWGTWQATSYDDQGDFYTFENVRFGKAPINELRFQKSVFPDAVPDATVIQSNDGAACYQYQPPSCSAGSHPALTTVLGPGLETRARYGALLPGSRRSATVSEDCLFADMYVPASAFAGNHTSSLPVAVYIYGGAFTFGAKDAGFDVGMPLYDATGIMRAAHTAGRDIVFVMGNYRLGAFGWLAGPTMEEFGTPNAGLWDQRLLFDFVKTHIPKVGGNASQISVWGESAGAGSIIYHLTSTEPPVWSRALALSPAYLWQWDRSSQGHPEQVFHNLTQRAGCPSEGKEALACLQALNAAELQKYNKAIIHDEWLETGLLPFNPAIDGKLIKHLPMTAFALGHFWKNITSILASHVYDEAKNFVPCYIKDDATFNQFLDGFMPRNKYPVQFDAVKSRYSSILYTSWTRARDIIQDSCFICNTRALFDAYSNTSAIYMMQYDFLYMLGAAVHAADLLPIFLNTDTKKSDFVRFVQNVTGSWNITAGEFYDRVAALSPEYQPYLASFAATGIPSPGSDRGAVWSTAERDDHGRLTNVMEVSLGITSDFTAGTTDKYNTESICEFWRNMSAWLEETTSLNHLSLPPMGRETTHLDL